MLEDLTKGEAQLNTLVEKRAQADRATAEGWKREAAYQESCRRADERRRSQLREEWHAHYLAQADRVEATARGIAAELRAKAATIARSNGGFSGEPAVVFREQHRKRQEEQQARKRGEEK